MNFTVGAVVCSTRICDGDVTTQTPAGNSYDAAGFNCENVFCCGTGPYPFCYFDGVSCYWSKLDDPVIRRNLLDLAKTGEVLVVSCKGSYRPLEAVLSEPQVPILSRRRDALKINGERR